ncbi:MAG TPA: DUF3800 domain-containing protein [Bauldia sp.]|nr:DUF3800 domain-containing protein [Bauldia sp.]
MKRFGDYIIYVDESGDHSLAKVDRDYPIFVLAFCILRKEDFAASIGPGIQEFKFRWFGHDSIVLHEREIRQQTAPFKFLQNPEVRARFMAELSELLAAAPMTIVAAVIDKAELARRYASPGNPYAISLRFCVERAAAFLDAAGQRDRITHCIFERRGAKEDAELELEFRRICDGSNYHGAPIDGVEIVFADKRTNSIGLQLADLTARPVGLHVLRPGQPNRAFDIIETKLRRNSGGDYRGWGLKVFP